MSSVPSGNPDASPPISGNLRVWPDEWNIGSQSDILYTKGIGACIGIATYDRNTQIGHIAHIYSALTSQKAILPPLAESIRNHSPNPSELTGWVIGGASEAGVSDTIDPSLSLRATAITHLGEAGLELENLHVMWNDDPGLLFSMSLDCSSGVFRSMSRRIWKTNI